jgi:hypothetical protein
MFESLLRTKKTNLSGGPIPFAATRLHVRSMMDIVHFPEKQLSRLEKERIGTRKTRIASLAEAMPKGGID